MGLGLTSQETEGLRPTRQHVQGHLEPKHQEIVLYNHLKQRYFLRSINYFQFSSDPSFFSPQLHIGDSYTSGKS